MAYRLNGIVIHNLEVSDQVTVVKALASQAGSQTLNMQHCRAMDICMPDSYGRPCGKDLSALFV